MGAMKQLQTGKAILAALAVAVAVALSGCATPPPADDPEAVAEFQQTNDPLEPTNRVLYKVNTGIDTVLIRPVVKGYQLFVPEGVRSTVHGVLANLASPATLANDMLQGKPRRAGDTLMRLLVNTTMGFGGIFDVASDMGYKEHGSDFGITLALWGVDEGPFLFLPLLGPSNPRDFTGYAGEILLDPLTYIGKGSIVANFGYGRLALTVVDATSRIQPDLDKALASALDPYATYRSLYRQFRQGAIERARADNRATVPNWFPKPAPVPEAAPAAAP